MAEPSTSYSLSSRGKKKRPRSPGDDDEQPPNKNQICTSLEDNLIFSDTMIALQLMRTQFPKLEKVVTQPFILQSQLYSSVKDRTQVDRDLESMKKDKVLRIFKLSSGQDDHAIMFIDDYLKQVFLCPRLALIGSTGEQYWTKSLPSNSCLNLLYSKWNKQTSPSWSASENRLLEQSFIDSM